MTDKSQAMKDLIISLEKDLNEARTEIFNKGMTIRLYTTISCIESTIKHLKEALYHYEMS